MSGASARISEKHDVLFPSGELEEMRGVQYAGNPSLLYGRGVASCSRGTRCGAVQRFEVRLKTAQEQRSRDYGLGEGVEEEEEVVVGRYSGATSQGVTPASTIMEEDFSAERIQPHNPSKGQAFVTETR